MEYNVKVMLSNHHCHLTKEACDALFGQDYELTPQKNIGGKAYACKETVEVSGPKGTLGSLRALAPVRRYTQVELLAGDCFKLGVEAPVRESGHLDGACELTLTGPAGSITVPCGIIAQRHLHIGREEAGEMDLADGAVVSARAAGDRAALLENMVVRTNSIHFNVIHLDMDEGNALGLHNGDTMTVVF